MRKWYRDRQIDEVIEKLQAVKDYEVGGDISLIDVVRGIVDIERTIIVDRMDRLPDPEAGELLMNSFYHALHEFMAGR